MKPFDLEKAKAGAEVCTRDGRPARIVCWDVKYSGFPLAVVVEDGIALENIYQYSEEGKPMNDYGKGEDDLFLNTTKKVGWVNVYQDESNRHYAGEIVHDDEEEAKNRRSPNLHKKCVDTIKIEWEE